LQEERVASVLNDTWEWLYRAEEARKAAEQLTDPDAKQCMLQLGRYYDSCDPLLLTGRGITLGSISVGSRTDFEAMNRATEIHRLHPVIDRTFPFAEAKEAYRHFEGSGHFGKAVIRH
jgi:D-arabinose 1-dehydrogenase-like Zn-dependent alcohol dehydrogenase